MPTILASTLIARAQTVLQDTTAVRWADTELLGWLNDGQREIVALRPSAYSQTVDIVCGNGTKQVIPAGDGIMLLDVVRNKGVGGATPGRAVRMIDRGILDAQVPTWHAATRSTEILHFMFDPRSPKVFYIYPGAKDSTQLEIVYSATPPDINNLGGLIKLDDIYANALLDYVLFRAYSKDTEYAGNLQRAAAARQSFENTLGLKAQADAANTAATNVRG